MLPRPHVETRERFRPSASRMTTRLAFALALIVASGIPLSAQFGNPYPGIGGGVGFPGGGIGLPGTSTGRGRNTQNGPSDTLNGKIKRISSSQLVMTSDDGRDLTIMLDRNTRYYDTSGNNARYGDFDNGDQVTVYAALDNQNYYHGQRITMVNKYSASDSNNTSSNAQRGSGSASTTDDDPDRPKLKRNAGGSSSDSGSANTSSTPKAQITDGDSSSTASNRPSTSVAPRAVARESDDPGPPMLRRDAPARVDNTPAAGTDASQMASGRPSITGGRCQRRDAAPRAAP